jgi:hypothetical protein
LMPARVKAYQEIDVLRVKATNVRIGEMAAGVLEATQRAKNVEKDATLENVVIKKMTGGTLDSKQDVGEVESGGSVTGVNIDTLGGAPRSGGSASQPSTRPDTETDISKRTNRD